VHSAYVEYLLNSPGVGCSPPVLMDGGIVKSYAAPNSNNLLGFRRSEAFGAINQSDRNPGSGCEERGV